MAIKRQRVTSHTAGRELNGFMSLPKHPNLLEIYGVFEARLAGENTLNIVFRYHNSSLHRIWHAAQGLLDLAEARKYSHDMFLGLAHLHRHSICHRDLVMPNLLLSFQDNCFQIADLGLAACAASFTLERNASRGKGVVLKGVRAALGENKIK